MTVKANVAGAVRMLRRLSSNLSRLQTGDPAAATAQIVGNELGDDIVTALGPHQRTGRSAAETLIQMSAKGVKVIAPYWLKFHPSWWDITKTKVLPVRYKDRAEVVFGEQVRALLSR